MTVEKAIQKAFRELYSGRPMVEAGSYQRDQFQGRLSLDERYVFSDGSIRKTDREYKPTYKVDAFGAYLLTSDSTEYWCCYEDTPSILPPVHEFALEDNLRFDWEKAGRPIRFVSKGSPVGLIRNGNTPVNLLPLPTKPSRKQVVKDMHKRMEALAPKVEDWEDHLKTKLSLEVVTKRRKQRLEGNFWFEFGTATPRDKPFELPTEEEYQKYTIQIVCLGCPLKGRIVEQEINAGWRDPHYIHNRGPRGGHRKPEESYKHKVCPACGSTYRITKEDVPC